VQELLKKCPFVTLLFGSLQRSAQMRRMFVAEFIDEAEVFVCFHSVEGEVSGTTQSIFHPLGVHGSELVREAEIDVITEAGFVRAVLPQRVECCHDVLFANVAVFRCLRQAGKVDCQVLRPILYILLRCRRASVLDDPSVDIIWKPFIELHKIFRDDESVVPDVMPIPDCEGIALAPLRFYRKTGKINGSVSDFSSIALHGELSFERNLDNMRASLGSRDELAVTVQRALSLPTKKEAEHIINTVIGSLETTMLNHLDMDGFTLKLNGFGKFYVRHRPGIRRRIGFSGQTIQTKMQRKVKFISLGLLRRQERVD
jgi:nucleoid DNA-binding protein